jgi:signal transduction histidine kinase/CheY-like chemotaxis protein
MRAGTNTPVCVPDHWKEITHADDVDRALGLWEHALKTGEPLIVEKRFRRASDGEYRWHLVQGVPIRDASGAITRWYGSNTDMEDQKRAIVTLAEANQRISRFLSVLSHELRNPISGIVTACELLARSDLATESRDKALATMSRQSTHLQRMIDDLLDISRVTQGIIELQREPCRLVGLLADVITDMEAEAREKRVELRFVHPDEDVVVDGDPVRLRQIIMNLIVNAIKASDPGRTVEISIRKDTHHCEVLVADQGVGLSPDVKNTLFEPFVQAETWRRKGLGLGLTIARQLTELHGGTIRTLDPEPKSGACFVVRLPIGGRIGETAKPMRVEHATRNATVLIVDDEKENAQALQLLLELDGHHVDVATDAEIAMARWHERNHSVVLCDLELPGPLDGLDVARALRMQIPRPYLIAYSGYGQPQDLINTREAGFDAHLVKPATFEQIVSAIGKAL